MNNTPVTVFTTSGCMQCRMTIKTLDANGIPYETRDITDHPDTANELRGLGFRQLPVVQAAGMAPWSGFRPDRIDQITAAE